MARKPPHRHVPTLTEVVQPAGLPPPEPGLPPPAQLPSTDELVGRVMDRIEPALEARLRETLAAIAIEQSRMLAPWLREEVEAAVRQALAEAAGDTAPAGDDDAPRR